MGRRFSSGCCYANNSIDVLKRAASSEKNKDGGYLDLNMLLTRNFRDFGCSNFLPVITSKPGMIRIIPRGK